MRRTTQRFLIAALTVSALMTACHRPDPQQAAKEIALGDQTKADSVKIKTLTWAEQEQLTDNIAFHYKEAIAHDESNLDAHKKLARVYYERGRTLACFHVLNKAKALNATDEEISGGLTSFATKSMQLIESSNGKDLGQSDAVALTKLARCYWIIGNTEKCKELLIQARNKDKTNAYVLATAFEIQGVESGAVLLNRKTTAPTSDGST